MSHKIFPQQFPTRFFLQQFPTRFSHKIFPQDFLQHFPARFSHKISCKISHKIFPQDFPQDFPQHFPTRFSCKILPQQFSHNNFPHNFPARFSRKNFPQDFPTRISRKIFPSWILIGWLPITLFQMLNFHQSLPFLNWLFPCSLSHKNFPQELPTRISRKIFPQDFPKLDPDWLAPHHPIPNAKFPPITAFLKLAFCPPPCPTRIYCKNFPQDFPAKFSHKIFPCWILIGCFPIILFQMLNFHQSLPC